MIALADDADGRSNVIDAVEDTHDSRIPTLVAVVVDGCPVRVTVCLLNTVNVVDANPTAEEPECTVKKKRKRNGISNRCDGTDRNQTTNPIMPTEERSTIIIPLKAQGITSPLKVRGKIESKSTAKSKATPTTKKKRLST